ncbi:MULTISPECIES: carbohydrate porin [unclassified Sphingomonas]|jgi:high affinity Mn2+ porin|uniref:carbohydrate porin n=1 Tax=unclassified Sphingomonas TaxID=196159 RepID=UPI000E103BE6|nr:MULTISPECIES: carbohydrate porin [unclassified Sphingomonas]AXJ96257.1 carbohydrate porin [Sphingomonas sp. FARSPH]
MNRIIPLLAGAWALAGPMLPAAATAPDVQDRAPTETAPAAPATTAPDETVAVHGQATYVVQATPGFPSPYSGPNSLTPRQARETIDVTLFAGVRPWRGGELWANPEVDQGFGLSNTLGVAGFPSAEAYKVGRTKPYVRLQRLFFRQTIGLGGAQEAVSGSANQLAGTRTTDRLVLTMGKFGVGDVFDTNSYAHDPRGDFLNWSAVDTGSFDYAADAWGYSTGIAAEWYRGPWTLRLGAFNLSTVPNGETLERRFGQYQLDAEVEHRHTIAGLPGAVRVTVFRNRGRFGRFDEALARGALTIDPVDTASVRRRRTRAGIAANAEQAVSDTLGIFARAGIADGSIEPYDFTDIDRTAQLGMAIGGAQWGRAADTIGAVVIVNGISAAHRAYLDAGGIGVLIGDGRLPHPGAEYIGEAYYKIAAHHGLAVTLDYQLVTNPGYNRDRGPANVFAVRLHDGF